MLATINIGAAADDGSGDDLRAAFAKVNAAIGALNALSVAGAGDIVGYLDEVADALSRVSERSRVLALPRDPLPADLEPGELRPVRNTVTGRVSLWVSDGATVRDLLDLSLA